MNSDSKIYALFGNPVRQSLSPVLHNATFQHLSINARYVALRVDTVQDALEQIKRLNIQGGSVTIPHKTTIGEYLDEISDSALRIGAVNTVAVSNHRLKGANTDWTGLVSALEELLIIKGKTFVILGAGGAARAAVYGIRERGGIPLIVNRTIQRGEKMAADLNCGFYPISDMKKIGGDCLINTTPVGMFPSHEKSPADKNILRNFRWVMDVIYNPIKTKFLCDAQAAGCSTISGTSMFVHQGAEQIRIWTGLTPPVDFMKNVVLEKLRYGRN
ncbi:MAG: shikimate dehydrogenase [Thermodesulfobacteriota bacterium]|nr:shikimate dehydrogenase [Thermodesulfobacteriota bacterium]